MTKQAFAQECDINHIVSRFESTGVIAHLNRAAAQYADVSQVGSFKEVLDTVRAVESEFLELPSSVRAEFNNDPAEFLDRVRQMSPEEARSLVLGDEGTPSAPPASVEAPAPSEGASTASEPEAP